MARIRIQRLFVSANDALPFEFGVFEIQEERQSQGCDIQVADHLGQMIVMKGRHYLRIGDYKIIDDEVRDKCADELTIVVYRKLFLLIDSVSTFLKFDNY